MEALHPAVNTGQVVERSREGCFKRDGEVPPGPYFEK